MNTPDRPAADPSSGPTPAETAHQQNLQALYEAMLDAEADPETTPAARETLISGINEVRQELDDLDAVEYHKNTVDLQAAEEELKSSLTVLQNLKKQLDADAAVTNKLTTVANALDAAIGTATTLGL